MARRANQIIFIEAFLASKKINWRCSYKLFKALKTTITFWCFVFVTLFNLQGTRCVLQRFLMISLAFPVVKSFFSEVFQLLLKLPHPPGLQVLSPSLSQATCLGYHTQSALSRTFSSFLNFFKLFQLPDLAGKNGQLWLTVCVGITYLSGPSPGKYFRQKRA